jgi:hypothetical protein
MYSGQPGGKTKRKQQKKKNGKSGEQKIRAEKGRQKQGVGYPRP